MALTGCLQEGHVPVTDFPAFSGTIATTVEAATHEVLREGGLEIRPGEYIALANGRPIALTVRELSLLAALARRAGRIVSREELYAVVWGRPFRKEERSVDVYVRKLRAKLEEALPGEAFIHTHFGFGYRFHREPSQVFHKAATPR
jgi:DNA-binding response OmpR family regulator